MPNPLPPEQRPGFCRHAWHWTAFYEDGSIVQEFGDDADHGFGDIDLNRIRIFQLDPVDPSVGRPAFCVLIDPAKTQRPIFFRRESINALTGEQNNLTCIGRQETVNGTNVSTYVFFDDEGHVVIADDRNAVG